MLNMSMTLHPSYKILAFIVVICTFFIRPFAMGLDYSIPGYAICAVIGFVVYNTLPHTTHNAFKIFKYVFFSYLLITLLTTRDIFDFVTRAGAPIIAYMLCANKAFMQLYFKYFKYAMLFIALCAICSFILEIFYPIDSLQIKHIAFPEDEYEYDLSFPFSLSLMLVQYDNVSDIMSYVLGEHSRQNLFFVEPGMSPTFLILLIILIYYNREKNGWIQILVFFLAMITTFSTTGLILVSAGAVSYYMIMNKDKLNFKHILIGAILAIVSIYAYLYMPLFGRNAKLESSAGVSVEDHENIMGYVIVGEIILVIVLYMISRLKKTPSVFQVISVILLVGYLANYIAFTFLFTVFLFYDQEPRFVKIRINKKRNKHQRLQYEKVESFATAGGNNSL